ncbi:keratin, type II cytoskeletal 4-like [Rhineura floridana]|uniref:keratin, type II cytoskeletal 4-like n=1 Tax=Rhineura floridana TaxID=261503 RepID=UPI002AC7FF1A|nr:keratin, type II cytoskeletal 4-like [Rhineura floridana]
MTQQMSAVRTFMGGRRFSSASAMCGLGGHRTYVASMRHRVGNGCRVHGFSSQSLYNMGRSRISCGSYGVGNDGCGSLVYGARVGHNGPRIYDSIGSCGPFRGYSNFRGDGIHGVRINEKLLKPLHVGVDPEEHEVRNHEREEMKNLNNQFACFIDKVRNLEQQNKILETKWNLLQEHVMPARKNLEPYYENFISNMKKELDCLLHEREHLSSEEDAIQHLVEELKCKYEEEFKRRTSAENEFVLLKKDVDSISLSKTKLEGKVDLLRRELEFRRCVYMEELAQLDGHVCNTNILLQMDNSRDLDMDLIIKNVEAWYQSIAQRSKEEANAFYENRFQELQEQRGKYSYDLKINRHEIADLTRLVHKLQYEHDAIKKQVGTLQTSICDAEQRGDCALKDARDKHIELQTALPKAKDGLAGLLRDYHELLNTKLALDIEIATYKTLLEGEESRICTGNLVSVDVVKPPYTEGSARFISSGGYGRIGGGLSGGYGQGYSGGYVARDHGRYHKNYSSRSVENYSRTGDSKATTRPTFADAEFYPGTVSSSWIFSHFAGKPSTPVGTDSSSARGEVGISVDCSPGAGLSSGSTQGSVSNVGGGHATGNIGGSGFTPAGAIPFGTGRLGPRIVGGPMVAGCQPGVASGVGFGNVGIQCVGGPAIGGIAFWGKPCVGAPVGVCYPGAAGAPVGVCYPGAAGAPVGVCYPGAAGAPVGVCYPGAAGAPVGVCYPAI